MTKPANIEAQSANLTLESTYFPVLLCKISAVPDKKDYVVLAERLRQYMDEEVVSVVVADLRQVTKLKLLAASAFWVPWATKNHSDIDRLSAGAVFVSDNAVVAKVVNGLLKLMPVNIPLHFETDMNVALDWVYRHATELDLPSRDVFDAL